MTDDAIDVVSKRCAHEDCDIFVSRKMWCATHDVEAVHQRRQRVRENQVAAFLSNSGFQWSKWNKQLGEPACGRYRPDFVYSLDTHVVIVEVDEDQHSTYDQSCERKRMLDIFSSFGGTPVTFLRYNPDIFQIGGATVRRTKQIRLQTLARRLQAALNTVPTNVLTIEYLFYNGADVSTYHVSPDDPSFVLHPVNSK
ncbi:hypothetical protein D9Q98_004108 [Chlorella vulgaris]|uniref:Uncharacterized protein n=1 Tax=Chlorella vulgaris TaxID=3077 RepID=A0A9D4TRA1_CHLVU|nr:hypothetical protein D9Q98_004108 [Chlorella vulgaris]